MESSSATGQSFTGDPLKQKLVTTKFVVGKVPNRYLRQFDGEAVDFETIKNPGDPQKIKLDEPVAPKVKITKMDETLYFKDQNNITITSSQAGKYVTPRDPNLVLDDNDLFQTCLAQDLQHVQVVQKSNNLLDQTQFLSGTISQNQFQTSFNKEYNAIIEPVSTQLNSSQRNFNSLKKDLEVIQEACDGNEKQKPLSRPSGTIQMYSAFKKSKDFEIRKFVTTTDLPKFEPIESGAHNLVKLQMA